MSEGDVTVRCLTPPGSAAIAVLELSGGRAWDIVREQFRPLSREPLPESPAAGLLTPGSLGPPPGDEVVLAVRAAGPKPIIEIQCHGGNEVVRWLIETIAAAGASVAGASDPGSRVLRTRDPGSLTPATEEALRLLEQAPSLRTASILLDQYRGAFDRALDAIDSLIAEDRSTDASRRVHEVLRFASLGAHLVTPWRIVLAGAPNVGKSSLLNALAGYQRCVVTPIPGTTRDVVTTRLVFDGWPVEVADTAGERPSDDPLEAAGVARSATARRDADMCVWVVETGAEPIWPPNDVRAPLVVINKIDQRWKWTHPEPADAVRVSALTGEGLDRLIAAIVERLVPIAPSPGAAVPLTSDQVAGLKSVEEALVAHGFHKARAVVAAMRSGLFE